MERNMVQKLGAKLNDIMNNVYAPTQTRVEIRGINEQVAKVAMREAGVTASDLQDEEQEDSKRVQLFWSIQSSLMAQVYNEAANQLRYVKGWNDLP